MGPCSTKDTNSNNQTDQMPLLNNQTAAFQQQQSFQPSKYLELQNDKEKEKERRDQESVIQNIGNLVHEKKGIISTYYQILSPPLGKGLRNKKNNLLFQGTYGEVRKAINKQSGMLRAIKIIHKRSTGSEDIERLMNEVEILKKLVSL